MEGNTSPGNRKLEGRTHRHNGGTLEDGEELQRLGRAVRISSIIHAQPRGYSAIESQDKK